MKILAFTDIHSDQELIKTILKKAEKVDFLICCGDFTFFGDQYKKVIKQLAGCKKTIFMIHGNHEEGMELKEMSKYKNMFFLHNKMVKLKENLYIFGFGGGGFSYTDEQLEKLIPKIKEKLKKDDKLILVTHQPPYKTELDIVASGHVGSMTIRKFISEVKPIIALSGHIHECFGVHDKIGNSILINPSDEGRIIELKLKGKPTPIIEIQNYKDIYDEFSSNLVSHNEKNLILLQNLSESIKEVSISRDTLEKMKALGYLQ